MELDSDSEKEKEEKLSFTIPQIHPQDSKTKNPKLDFEIKQDSKLSQKIEIEIKREPQKSTQDYLEILKKLNTLLNSHSITDAQRRDYCKSQRYFMKLYFDHVNKD